MQAASVTGKGGATSQVQTGVWPRLTVSVAAILGLLGVLVATAATGQPKSPDLDPILAVYPFIAGPIGLAFTVLGAMVARRQPANPWAAIVSIAGILLAANAAIVAGETYAGTPLGSQSLRVVFGWIEEWAFIPTDLFTLTWLLLLYPAGNVSRRWLPVVGVLGWAMPVLMLTAMFGPGHLDGTSIDNPLGFLPLPVDIHEALFPVLMLAGLVVTVVRLVSLARSGARGTAIFGAGALLALVVGVVGHKALGGTPLPAASVYLLGYLVCAAIATVGVINHGHPRS